MEFMRRHRGTDRDVVPAIGRLREEIAARPKYSPHLAKHVERIVEMLEDVVADHDIEARVRVGDRLAEALSTLVEIRILCDARIGIDPAYAPRELP